MGDVLAIAWRNLVAISRTRAHDTGELTLSAAFIAVAATTCVATVTRAYRAAAESLPEPSACASVAGKSGRVRVEGVIEPGPDGTLTDPASGEPCVWYSSPASSTEAGASGERVAAPSATRTGCAFIVRDLTGTTLVRPTSLRLLARGDAQVLRPGERITLVATVDYQLGTGPVLVGDPMLVRRLPADTFGRREPPRAPIGVRVGIIVTAFAGLAGVFLLGLTFRH